MDQIINLDKHDDILKVHSKIEWSDGRRVILVVPRGCKALDSEHELQLLRRYALDADVPVALVSTAYTLRELAPVVGIPIFSSVSRAQRADWKWARANGHSDLPRGTALDGLPSQPRRPLLDQLGLAGWQLLVTLGIFGAAAFVLVWLALLFIPSASITLVPASSTISDASDVALDPAVTTIDHINAILPATTYRSEISGTMTINTSRTATAPAEYATGDVVFTNLQGSEAEIPLGTIVATTTGATQRYATTITATLPSGFNARVTVPVRAVEPGPRGNVGALQVNLIEGPLSAVARVVNVQPMQAGTIKEVHVVSFEDRQVLRERLRVELRRKGIDQLQKDAGSDVYIVPASVDVIVLNETFDHLVDDPSDTLTLHIEAVATAVAADFNDLDEFAQRRLLSKLPSGFSMLEGTMRVEADPNARLEANSAIIRVRSAMLATPNVNADKLFDGLYGKPVAEVSREIEKRLELAEPPVIRVNPSWWPRMPNFGFRLALFVKPEVEQ